jgi:branched-chain amino acid aminotransferase
MSMPIIPENLFVECVRKLVELDREWIPNKPGYSLYIRPFMFSTDEFVGIRPSENYKFMIFSSPVGAYYNEPVNVLIEEHYTRAAEGGVGRAKAAGNYGASLYPAKQGQLKGYHQLLWTDAKTHEYVEESGTMNIVFVIDGKIITPSEESDTILRGITKRSVLEVAQQWGYEIEERKISVKEVIESIKNGSCTEAFGAGTAATIAHIHKIGFRGEDFVLPAIESRTFSLKMSNYLSDLKSGVVEDEWGWLLKA